MNLGIPLACAARNGKGLSLHLDGSVPTSGYVVGVSGYEMRVHKSANVPSLAQTWAAWTIARANRVRSDTSDIVLGVWIDGGHVYYDLSVVIADRDLALTFARTGHQLAIWDIDNACEIRLD